nr:cation:dicarboxylase symporter family transporter [Mucilaginibacter terrigena]
MKRLITNLTFQVIVAIILGIVVGLYFKEFAATAQMISKIFISLITLLIAPIIFLPLYWA